MIYTTIDHRHKTLLSEFNNNHIIILYVPNNFSSYIDKYKIYQNNLKKYEIDTYWYELEYFAKSLSILINYYRLINNYNAKPYNNDKLDIPCKNIYDEYNPIIINNQNINKCKISFNQFQSPKTTEKYYSRKKIKPITNLKKYDAKFQFNDRSQLLNYYLHLIDNKLPDDNNTHQLCDICSADKTLNLSEGLYICHNCGNTNTVLTTSEYNYSKDSIQEIRSYPYKKINHFNEIINQIQGKESTEIPKYIFDKIKYEIDQDKVLSKNYSKLTILNIRNILKKLNLNKYYEHIPYILYKLSGIAPIVIDRDIENKLRTMFRQIQEPFSIVCPKTGPNKRKNFLSYYFILFKFCELLNITQYNKSFPMLKSIDKLVAQDKIWKNICEYLEWKYIPSV